MAKFYGPIGYVETVESEPGLYEEQTVEYMYTGDWVRNTRKLQTSSDSVNDNINVANELSIISDPYSTTNFLNMRYVGFMGAKWKVTNVEVKYPRLVLTIGGLYNGK